MDENGWEPLSTSNQLSAESPNKVRACAPVTLYSSSSNWLSCAHSAMMGFCSGGSWSGRQLLMGMCRSKHGKSRPGCSASSVAAPQRLRCDPTHSARLHEEGGVHGLEAAAVAKLQRAVDERLVEQHAFVLQVVAAVACRRTFLWARESACVGCGRSHGCTSRGCHSLEAQCSTKHSS